MKHKEGGEEDVRLCLGSTTRMDRWPLMRKDVHAVDWEVFPPCGGCGRR